MFGLGHCFRGRAGDRRVAVLATPAFAQLVASDQPFRAHGALCILISLSSRLTSEATLRAFSAS
jgi:hypothetical protein